jgi:cytochrome c-type biogenesis protein CcmH/NrfF
MCGIGEAVVWVLPWALLAAVVAAAVTLAVRRRRGRAGSPALRAGGEGGTSEEPERPVDHIG